MKWIESACPVSNLSWIDGGHSLVVPKRVEEYERGFDRLKSGLGQLPVPYGFREGMLGLRAMIRALQAEKADYANCLSLLHWLAAVQSLGLERAERLCEPGHNVFEAIPLRTIHGLDLSWNAIGCDNLATLTKTDKRWMVSLWGAPNQHTTANALYSEVWLEAEEKLLRKRAQSSGKSVDDYAAEQKRLEEKYRKEYEARQQMIAAEHAEQAKAAERVASLMGEPIFLDLETTGLYPDEDEILEIGIVDEDGTVLMDELVKPTRLKEWPEAERIHGISPRKVKRAPTLTSLEKRLSSIIKDRLVVIYNAEFDVSFLPPDVRDSAGGFVCAMRMYRTISKGRARLMDAERWAGVSRSNATRHRAVGDAIATAEVWRRMRRTIGDDFPAAVSKAAHSPIASSMKSTRIARDRDRLSIVIDLSGGYDEAANSNSEPTHSGPKRINRSRNLTILILLGVLVLLAVIWMAN